ncbi:MAG: Rieske 2Fe-2S domain-containing protein [Bacteroidetes bacterium]|nr:Rieske 2Fe-2S domain-containing protein [Bacteroidota bacterium]
MMNLKASLVLFLILLLGFACKKNNPAQSAQNNPVYIAAANTPVNVQVYISAHPALNTVGGVDTIANVGVKGLIIYHASNQFYAYDRACTYDGTTKSNAAVNSYQTFNAKCPACNSQYSISDGGGVLKNPATIPLKQYTVSYDASTNILQITN